jgi:hypothetical protein
MRTLYLAWQDSLRTRSWYPIGRLDADLSLPLFRFGYTGGAIDAHDRAGLQPLDSFPHFREVYESNELFPLFRNRVLSSERSDFSDYLKSLDLKPENADPLEILAVSGGERQTDSLEVFPRIERTNDGSFRCRFFLHGWRHVSSAAQEQLLALPSGQALRVAVELNNPVTTLALQLLTPNNYHMIGWAPRYLVNDLLRAIAHSTAQICAKVVKINPAPTPAKQRVLIELAGHLPDSYEPMSTPEFQLLVH